MRLYKLLDQSGWEQAQAEGVFTGSAVDIADGFIHFSTAAQAGETARRYFAGRTDLVLLTVDSSAMGDALRWEPARGGDLFPHLYESLPTGRVIEARRLRLGADGAPELGDLAS